MNTKFKEGEVVAISASAFEGCPCIGRVRGVANLEMPPIGATYIIETIDGKPLSENYPFSCFTCFEMWMHKADKPKE